MSKFDIGKVLEVLTDKERIKLSQDLKIKIPGFANITKAPLSLFTRVVTKKKFFRIKDYYEKYLTDNGEINENLLIEEIKNGECNPGLIAVYLYCTNNQINVEISEKIYNLFLQKKKNTTNNKTQIVTTKAADGTKEIAVLNKKIAKQAKQIETLGQQKEKLTRNLSAKDETIKKVSKENGILVQLNEKNQHEIANLEDEVTALKEQIHELEKQCTQQNEVIEKLSDDNKLLINRINNMENDNNTIKDNVHDKAETSHLMLPGIIFWNSEKNQHNEILGIRKSYLDIQNNKEEIEKLLRQLEIKEVWYINSEHQFAEISRLRRILVPNSIEVISKRYDDLGGYINGIH